jgi:hypothetical protein
MKYRRGYKYQLAKDEIFKTPFRPTEKIRSEFIDLDTVGILTVKAGYAWDGASGPTIDTKNTMRASLAHDALYQLIRQEYLPYTVKTRHMADDFLYTCLIEDGMWRFRAMLWRRELKKFAGFAADPKSRKKIYTAP